MSNKSGSSKFFVGYLPLSPVHTPLKLREGVKKLSPAQKGGRDVETGREAKARWAQSFQSFTAAPLRVNSLQRKTLIPIVYLQGFVSFTLSCNCLCKTLEIFLPARLPNFFTASGDEGRLTGKSSQGIPTAITSQ